MTTLVLAALLVAAEPSEPPRPATPDDFAYGARLEPVGGRPVQRVIVPEVVYDVLTTADLRDVAVFNAAGEQVPHAVRRVEAQEAGLADRALPVFPIKAKASTPLSSLALSVQRDPSGAIVELRTQQGVAAGGGDHLVAYLVDTGALERPTRALTFVWDDENASFVQLLTIEQSEDLTQWSPVVRDMAVARLLHGDHRIERQRLEFSPVRARYLRVTWSGQGPPVPLNNIIASLATDRREPDRVWRELGSATEVEPFTYRVTLRGRRPVDRVRITPHATNSVAQATLSSGPSADGPWATRFAGLVYRLELEGSAVSLAPVTVDVVSDPVWQLEVSPQGGGLGGPPSFAVGWIPHELVFVSRGAGPFTLAYGSADHREAGLDAAEVLRLAGTRDEESGETARVLEAQVQLGGEQRLVPTPARPKDRGKTLVLWLSLVVAVGILAFMSVRLVKQMGAAA